MMSAGETEPRRLWFAVGRWVEIWICVEAFVVLASVDTRLTARCGLAVSLTIPSRPRCAI